MSAASRQLRRPGVSAAAAPATAPPASLQRELPVAPVAALAPAVPLQPEPSALIEQAAVLLREQQELAAAKAQLAQEKQQLVRQLQEVQAAQQQLKDGAAQIRLDAERLGYEQGQRQAGREAVEATATQVARLNTVVQTLTQSKRALLDENQDLLVEIAFAAVCRILGTSAAGRAGLASMVGELIAAERDPETLRVRVHPQDLEQLSQGAPGLDPRLAFLADSGIELGGCLIDGPRGTLDARLELQLQHLRAALMLVRQQRSQNEAPV
jgi:flagellar assembly protein FliH